MSFIPPLSRRFMVARLAPGGEVFRLEADEAARQAIATAYGLPSVSRFVADFRLSPEGKAGARLKGMVEAAYEQLCVVTLEPFARTMREPVDLAFAPAVAPDASELEVEFSSEDPPEPIENGEIDAGAVACEFFALSLDPYPKKPGAEFTAAAADTQVISPFAALAALRKS